ncbi:MAG: LiaF domain-containing protein, partial [Jiangellaceae bacterium]
VFGGTNRRGEWVVPTRYRVKAIFGGVELDLRDARLESHEVAITIKAVFGGVNIVVPDDIQVIVDGSAVFGGFDDSKITGQPGAGAPVVHVGGKAVFGGVSVQRKPTGRP